MLIMPRRLFISLLFMILFDFTVRGRSVEPGDSLLNIQLFQTIRSGNATKLEELLNKGVPANSLLNGYSALMAAALNGTLDEMKLLIDHGAAVNYYNKDSISAIWLGIPDMEKTKLLISKGADVNWRSKESNTLLIKLATMPGSISLMQMLISKGCDPKHSGVANDLMYNAAGSCDTAMVGLLIRSGLSVNDTSSFGDYPVNSALNYRCFNTLKMLVDNGANVNVSASHAALPLLAGITPLMWAAVSNDKPSFYYLLQHGADAKAKSPGGYTTLMFLAMSDEDDPAMTRALIEHGALPAEKAFDETDALYHAKLKGNTKSAEILSAYTTKK
jgi:uncharacterized protein